MMISRGRFFRGCALLLFWVNIAGAQPLPRSVASIKRGDEVLAIAHDVKQSWRAIGYYREALKAAPGSYEALWRLARAFSWLTEINKNQTQNMHLGQQGYAYALRAIKREPRRIEGHYWAALCVGEYGRHLGILSAINQGIGKKFITHLEQAKKISTSYYQGGVHRVFAMYYHMLPWPMKDNRKALKHLRHALAHGRHSPLNHYCLAQILDDESQADKAKRSLQACLRASSRALYPSATARYRRLCRQLLRSISASD